MIPDAARPNSRAPLVQIIEQQGDDDLIYDVGTNRFLWLDRLSSSILPLWGVMSDADIVARLSGGHGEEAIRGRLACLEKVERERGWLRRRRPRSFVPPWSADDMRRSLATGLDCLVLSVTEACNYRCSYCVYGGDYVGQRAHGTRSMRLDTAAAAVEFFAAHASAAEELHLNFYGGEPLLNQPVVRWALQEFATISNGRKCFYHLTTNGWCLHDPAVRRLLADHDVILMVSLDGPEHIHDRRRRTARGDSTFARVLQAMESLQREFPDYFRGSVMVNAVLDSVADLPAVRDFFLQHPVLSQIEVVCSTVRKDRLSPPSDAENRVLEQLEEELYDAISAGQTAFDSITRRVFVRDLARVHRRAACDGCALQENLTGVCIPGRKELFVDPGGRFHLCENTSDGLLVGSLERGFDLDEVERIVGAFASLATERCGDCFAYRFCRLCYMHAFSGPDLDRAKMDSYCQRERGQVLATLRRYATLQRRAGVSLEFLEARAGDEAT